MNTTKTLLTALSAVLAFGVSNAYAADGDSSSGESKLKVEDVKQGQKVKDASDNVDEVITNRKLRAETGSKSKFSLATSFNYQGSTLEKPFAKERPNITDGANTQATAALTGTVSGKMRLGKMSYLKSGFGLRIEEPLQQTADGKKDVNNPNVDFGYIYKAMGLQNSFVSGLTAYTTEFTRDNGYLIGWDTSNTSIKSFKNGLSVGLYSRVTYNFFDKNDVALEGNQSDYGGGLYPFLEYVINDTFNLRTISGVWVYDHYRGQDGFKFVKNTIYQSFGLGISMTRDIYLYPNIQVIPEDIRADRTNVAMSATINMF